MERFNIEMRYLIGYQDISKYIRHYCPELAASRIDGYALLYAFVGERPNPTQPREAKPPRGLDVNSDTFLLSYEWRRVRMEALKKYGPRCQCCGASAQNGVVINVDHIKPRRLFPQLALDVNNLQVLCETCNHGKGNWDMTDWRAKPESIK